MYNLYAYNYNEQDNICYITWNLAKHLHAHGTRYSLYNILNNILLIRLSASDTSVVVYVHKTIYIQHGMKY